MKMIVAKIIAANTILENHDFLLRDALLDEIISSKQRASIESRLKLNFSFQS